MLLNEASLKSSSVQFCKFAEIDFFFSISKLLPGLTPFLRSRAEARLRQLEKTPSSLAFPSRARAVL